MPPARHRLPRRPGCEERGGIAIITSSNNLIGGTVPGARNVISGNANYGILLNTCHGAVVQGNFIGVR
jgi:hypothetical protein